MERNEFLLFNEIIYHIHTCTDLDDLKRSVLAQIKLLIPFSYASLISVRIEPETRAIIHSDPFCLPESFRPVEEEWIAHDHEDNSYWVSHAPESIIVRRSELEGEDRRKMNAVYQKRYRQYGIYDSMIMNLTYDHEVFGLLNLYRTQADGVFTDEETFFLRALSKHINFAYHRHLTEGKEKAKAARPMEELVREHELTRREEEILGLIFRGLDNEAIVEKLAISKHTLHKHLQNIYHKCGISSRWELLQLLS